VSIVVTFTVLGGEVMSSKGYEDCRETKVQWKLPYVG
jgi:hypothetical protein